MDMLSDNPCRRVTVPKGESKEKEIYTIDEVKQIIQKIDSEPLKWKLYIMLVKLPSNSEELLFELVQAKKPTCLLNERYNSSKEDIPDKRYVHGA